MEESTRNRRQDAWLFAHKLITLAKEVRDFAAADFIHVTTEQLCVGMGQPGGSTLEQVQRFARDVVELMRGYGLDTACGCGYLALTVGPDGRREALYEQGRAPRVYTPDDLDDALDRYLVGSAAGGTVAEESGASVACSSPDDGPSRP